MPSSSSEPMASASPAPSRPGPPPTSSSRWANWRVELGVDGEARRARSRTTAASARSSVAARRRSRPRERRPAGTGRRRAARSGRRGLGPHLVERRLQPGVEVVERLLGLLERDVAPAHQRLGVELAHRALGVDALVHERLGVARVVALVVAVAAVADEVDDHVLVERSGGSRRRAGPPGRRPRGRRRSRGRSAPGPSWPRRSGTPRCGPTAGAVVKPSWLLMTTCTVPPVR